MIHKKIIHHVRHFHHHFLPHNHVDGREHSAHALSVVALSVYFSVFVLSSVGFYFIKANAPQILGAVTFSADQIISLTNAKRAQNGLGAVTFNPLLAQAATQKASNMFSENYWAHNSPSGRTPWSFISAAGYKYVYAGENLARDFSDASSVVNAWMNSPSHRSNLLDKNFKEIGVAVADGNLTGNSGILVVQMFGTPTSQIPTTPTLALASPAPSPSIAPASRVPAASPAVAQALQSPLPSPSPVLEVAQASPTPAPTSVTIAQTDDVITPTSQANTSEARVLASRQFSIARGISFGLIAFIFLMFVAEVIFVAKRENLHLRSGIFAHLGLLAFVLIVIWYAVSGAIL
ncbi:MAG: CAP domain-containing protein [Patescibacteria group bacterium]